MDDYEQHDAVGLAQLVAQGAVSPQTLLQAALERVQRWDPHINAVVHPRPDAAQALIRDLPAAAPLRGVPFLLKDLGAEARDFPGCSGSRLLLGARHDHDSEIYRRLRAAGLVSFARTTSPEFGIGPVTEAQVYGAPTRNPWDLGRSPGGSSGGAAAAVAAGVVPAAHGSDGGGSLRIPASCCGLLGFKATRARLPDGPVDGESWGGMAIDGFITRTVRDTAMLLDATAGADAGAPYRAPPLRDGFTAGLQRPPPALRVAVVTTTLEGEPIHPDCVAAVEDAAALLQQLGHCVEMARPLLPLLPLMQAWTRIVACGTALTVREVLAQRDRPLEHRELEPVTHAALRLARGLSGADYLHALTLVHGFGRRMAGFFQRHDVLLSATLAEPPCVLERFAHDNPALAHDFLDYRLGAHGVHAYSPFTVAFNATGQPAVSVPLHRNAAGLPIGVQLASAFGEDELLLSLCAQLEQARPWQHLRPPLPARVPAA
jgi:amidase/6-aminohexanoate-cyclic-dimer hydrolase